MRKVLGLIVAAVLSTRNGASASLDASLPADASSFSLLSLGPTDVSVDVAATRVDPSSSRSQANSLSASPFRQSISQPTTNSIVRASQSPQDVSFLSRTSLNSSDASLVLSRRVEVILDAVTGATSIASWLSALQSNGKWPDSEVDYTTGCDARRSNWPIQTHWERITTLSAAYHGNFTHASQWTHNATLLTAIESAMTYWFENDYTEYGCLYEGGADACPCETPGFWNTNWYSNVLLIPIYVGKACLLLSSANSSASLPDLPTHLKSNCTHTLARAYTAFDSNQSFVSGANILDMASSGIDGALFSSNNSWLADAFERVQEEVRIKDQVGEDGIRRDGSFGQHIGIIYNGNYGKDYSNDYLALEIEAAGTRFAADDASKEAFETLIGGELWMIYRNTLTDVLHWDFSVLGRMISFAVADNQATASLKTNLSQISQLGQEWDSDVLTNAYNSLVMNTTDANSGALSGNRMFYTNDYMVQRGSGYVTTLRMYSSRTKNTECTNSQNLLGFHLADGLTYTYVQGDEYEDIAAAWDWNLLPGITVDYGATPLNCDNTGWSGVEDFVGGTSTGNGGAAAMRYTNPYAGSLSWQKAWFFLNDDVQHVMVSNISSTTEAPVYSVLDQRRRSGEILVDGAPVNRSRNYTSPHTLWHGGVGYAFHHHHDCSLGLSLSTGNRTGNWSTIGTSNQGSTTVDLFVAWIHHKGASSLSYSIFPATDYDTFISKKSHLQLRTLQNDAHISGVYDIYNRIAMIVFWDESGGSVEFSPSLWESSVTVQADENSIVIWDIDAKNVTVSDPSQKLARLHITLSAGIMGFPPPGLGVGATSQLTFDLPSGGLAGGSSSQTIS